MSVSLHDAGYIDHDNLDPEDTVRGDAVRLSEVRQLLVPETAELPPALKDVVRDVVDACELGHVIFETSAAELPIVIVRIPAHVATVALKFPKEFRLSPAVLTRVPHTEYTPRFEQAVFGLREVTWSYLVEALRMDDSLRFETRDNPAAAKRPGARSANEEIDDDIPAAEG